MTKKKSKRSVTKAAGLGESAPPDLAAKTLGELAKLAGLHRNSVLNYQKAGIRPEGRPPWSLGKYFLLLRRHGKLAATSPESEKSRALRTWAFGGGEEPDAAADGSDPDAPLHAPPHGWQEERSRQGALKSLKERQKEELELEVLRRERIPIADYRQRWQRRARQVLAALDLVMAIPKAVGDLPERQRQALVSACRQTIHDIRAKIAGQSHAG